jgi:putative two-component system response regulator
VSIESTILVADPDSNSRKFLRRLLNGQGHVVVTLQDGTEILRVIEAEHPDLIMLDAAMPDGGGLTMARRLREDDATRALPMIVMTTSHDIEDVWRKSGADAVLRKPFNQDEVTSWTQCLVRAGRVHENLERAETALQELAVALEARSLYPEGHLRRVAGHAARLAAAANLDPAAVVIIRRAALLHDIGYVGVPDGLLRKPAALSADEYKMMTKHTVLGADLCRYLLDGEAISAIIRSHHEHWDGRGYPDGLAGERIPLGARIVAVADAFDVLTMHRPYRPAVSETDALDILLFGAGQQWDPQVVATLDNIVRPALENGKRGGHRQRPDKSKGKKVRAMPDPVVPDF